jgi:hypothetical protein
MTKNKNKKNTRKPRNKQNGVTGQPTKNQRTNAMTSSLVGKHGRVVGLTNPFSEQAKGARIPDDDSAFSVPFQLRTTVHLTTVVDQASITVQANPNALYKQGATYSGTTISTWGNYAASSDFAAVSAEFTKYRIVSFGVRFFNTAAPLYQSGTLRAVVVTTPAENGIDVNGGMWNSVTNESVAGTDLHWIAKPAGVDWKEYTALSTNADWDSLTVLFVGLPTASSFPSTVACEIVMNMEMLTTTGSVVSVMAKPGALSDPTVLQATSHVHAKHKGVHNSGPSMMQQLGNLAKNALIDIASAAMPMAGAAARRVFGGQSSSSYPMIVD